MPIYKVGDMWSAFDEADLFCITTNSTIIEKPEKVAGKLVTKKLLVMGRGIAGRAKLHYPLLPEMWGRRIVDGGKYGLIMDAQWDTSAMSYAKLAAFQTKYHWRNPSPIELVAYSISMLKKVAEENPNKSIHLPFPGIGNGGLNPFDVKPLLDNLPENVTVWRDK